MFAGRILWKGYLGQRVTKLADGLQSRFMLHMSALA